SDSPQNVFLFVNALSELFKCFGDERGRLFVWNDCLGTRGLPAGAISQRRWERPAPILKALLHPFYAAFSSDVVIQFRDTREHYLNEFSCGTIVYRLRHGPELYTHAAEDGTQLRVIARVSGETVQFVNDHSLYVSGFPAITK